MVKVISAYNFQQQDTYPASGDIAATCLIGSSRLVIAHRSHLIEIVTLKRRQRSTADAGQAKNVTEESLPNARQCYIDQNDNCQPTKIAFPTIDQVQQLHYCAAGNYLITLEEKSIAELASGARQQQRRTFVRAYTNFDIAGSVDDCFSVPIRARIAAKTTPNVTCSDHIEVIEIPVGQDDGRRDEPHLVTCCQTSGTVAVCCNEQIHFYECKRRTNDANKFQFIDFLQAPFYVRLDFVPCKLSLTEHVVACLDRATVVAFKIVDLGDTGTEDGTTTNSMETDSSANLMLATNRAAQLTAPGTIDCRRGGGGYSSGFKRNRTIDFEVAKQYKQANGLRFQTDIRSNWDHENGRRSSAFAEDRPYLVNDVKIVLKSTREHIPSNDRIFYSLRSLVQLRLHQQQQQQQNVPSGAATLDQGITTNTIHDEFRCLALKPIYFKLNAGGSGDGEHFKDDSSNSASYDLDADSGHVMKSCYHRNCIGFTLFISTVSDGYVYQFTNQGKWYAENTKCLAVYPFTSPVVDVVIDSYVIHAVTESGIETFSSRIGHKLFSSYFEYPMISDPYPNETSPLVDVPICVMGICGFFGIRHVAASASNLVLLTTDSEPARRKSNGNNGPRRISGPAAGAGSVTQNSRRTGNQANQSAAGQNNNATAPEILDWTIYDLELPRPEQLVDDIESLACIYRQSSPEIYYELIEEAHVIIRLARELFFIPTFYEPRRLPAEQETYRATLHRSYTKTCKMLADFTIQSTRKETYSQAVAYYSMCKHSIQDIYSSYRQNASPDDNHDGLMYTLTMMLSKIGANKSAIEYLTQTLPVSAAGDSEAHAPEAAATSDRTCAEELFDLFEKHSPDDLIHVALNSSVFREILCNRFEQLFASTDAEKLSPEQKMCQVLCLCYQSKYTQALGVFETMRRSQLYAVLRDYWSQILFDNFRADNYRKCSFSDLTECILFVTERPELVEAVADVLVQILVVARTIDLNFVIKLFMNYFAMSVGCPGYRTSQRILEIVLQAYFYDFYKYSSRNAGGMAMGPELHETHDDNFGLVVTECMQAVDVNAAHDLTSPAGVGGIDFPKQQRPRQNSLHQQLSDHSSASTTTVESNYDDPEFEAMKILFRMYLGLLKQYTTDNNVASRHGRWTNGQDVTTILPDINAYRLAFIDYLSRNVAGIKLNHSKFDSHAALTTQQLQQQMAPILPDYDAIVGCARGGAGGARGTGSGGGGTIADSGDEAEYFRGARSFRRPIVFFERRENFLNKMSPLCLKTDINGVPFSNNWDEISLVVIKLQSLLNSGKLDGSLIGDLIIFIQSNPNVIGVDSLLTLLLPKPEAIEFLIHTNPQYLLDYAKARLATSNQWQVLFKRILSKKRELNAETQQSAIELFDRITEDILRYLVNTKTLDEFLDCIPEQEISRHEQQQQDSHQHQPQSYSGNCDGICSGASSGDSATSGDRHVDQTIKDNSYWKVGKYRIHAQDGINETNPFELIMREAVIKQRSDALDAMIQSSGRQLNDAVNFQLNLN